MLGLMHSAARAQGTQRNTLVLKTASPKGVYQKVGDSIVSVLAKHLPSVTVRTESSDGSVANMKALSRNEADLAIVQSDIAHYAARGIEVFEHSPIRGVATLMGLHYEDVLVVGRRSRGYSSVAAILADARVVVGPANSGTQVNARDILEALGLDFGHMDKIDAEPRQSLQRLASSSRDSVDVVFLTAGYDSALGRQITEAGGQLLSLGQDLTEALRKERPYYEPSTIDIAGVRVNTVKIRSLLVARAALPSPTVYAITKALYRNFGVIRAAHQRAAEILPSSVAETHALGVHDGAKTLFCEARLRTCNSSFLVLVLFSLAIGAVALGLWFSTAFRTFCLRFTPRDSHRFFGKQGVTERYRIIVAPLIVTIALVFGAYVTQAAEGNYAERNNLHSDFEDIGLNKNLVWTMVFTASGFEDGRFPQSMVGKVTSSIMAWIGIGGILWLVTFTTSDHIARKMRMHLETHPDRLRDHLIVCGWNSRAFDIVERLAVKSFGPRRHSVIVVSEKAPPELEKLTERDAPVAHMAGNPADIAVLTKAGLAHAHSVVILADDEVEDPDGKTLMTLTRIEKHSYHEYKTNRRKRELRTAVEVLKPENRKVFEQAHADLIVCGRDFDSLLLVNSLLNPALPQFLNDILAVNDSNMIIEVPVRGDEKDKIVGMTFDEALSHFRKIPAVLLAIHAQVLRATNGKDETPPAVTGTHRVGRRILANPKALADREYQIKKGDSLLFLADSEKDLEVVFGKPERWRGAFESVT